MGLITGLILSSLIGAGLNFAGQQITAHQDREHSSAEAEKARNWQEEMRGTNYQASVEDIEEAGLNPAMLYGSGGAGVSPTPSSAIGNGGSHNGSMYNIAQVGELLNSITNARALDYKMKGRESYTSKQIYDKSGQLLTEIIKDYKSN